MSIWHVIVLLWGMHLVVLVLSFCFNSLESTLSEQEL